MLSACSLSVFPPPFSLLSPLCCWVLALVALCTSLLAASACPAAAAAAGGRGGGAGGAAGRCLDLTVGTARPQGAVLLMGKQEDGASADAVLLKHHRRCCASWWP